MTNSSCGDNFHGRTVWAVKFLTRQYVVTGCESGLLNLSQLPTPFEKSTILRSYYLDCFPSAIRAISSIRLSHSDALDSEIMLPESSNQLIDFECHLVFASGGMEVIKCWILWLPRHSCLSQDEFAIDCENIAEYPSNRTDHTQRVLALEAFHTSSGKEYLIFTFIQFNNSCVRDIPNYW